MKIKRSRSVLRALAATAAALAALTACSSQGGAQNQPGAAGGQDTGNVGGKQYTFQMITHEVPGDTFWDKIRAGGEDAAKALNVNLQYSNNRNAPDEATLVQNAIDSKVDGIAVTFAFPDAVGPVVQKAIDAKIPVVAFNSGIDDYAKYGVGMYFGSNETLGGVESGKRIAAAGGQKALCINPEQGQVALEARCNGVKQGFPNTEVLYVENADLPSVRATVASKLQQDPSITDIVALGGPVALATLQARGDAGSQARISTFDLNADVAKAIKDGQLAFSIDQQPYVQGFMAVTSLWMNITNGNDMGGGQPVLTGPSVVDAKNIDVILPFAGQNRR